MNVFIQLPKIYETVCIDTAKLTITPIVVNLHILSMLGKLYYAFPLKQITLKFIISV